MGRLHRGLATAICVTAIGTGAAVAQTRVVREGQTAALLRGSITGSVVDERGGALAGVVVSALGGTIAVAVSDARGLFSLKALPTGEYVVQAHLQGFAGSTRERLQVRGATAAVHSFQLRRLGVTPLSASGPVAARPIMAAGFALPGATLADKGGAAEPPAAAGVDDAADHSHTETAWRLRHIKRSILKDAAPVVALGDDNAEGEAPRRPKAPLWRAVDSASLMAATLFGATPLSGEVNLLTTGAFAAPGDLFSGETIPRGVAYLSIGAPAGVGEWSVRAAMSQGDLSSWNLAGSFVSRPGSTHSLDLGLSYSRQDYAGGNPAALAAVPDNSRNVGEVYAFDHWQVAPRLSVEYGTRYARHDYLQRGDQFSPRASVSVAPLAGTRIVTTMAQRMVAPGAEEFLSTNAPGPWLPPERTFAPLPGAGDPADMRVERARTISIGIEHDLKDASVVSVQRFYQRVDDQLVTLFGVQLPEGPDTAGHYFVASAGGVDADGWSFRVSNSANPRLKGAIDYSITRASWQGRAEDDAVGSRGPAWRPQREELHDITTSLETAIPETATRVVVIYKVNTGYARADQTQPGPGLDGRFDLQLNQGLPFDIAGTRWEVLLGVRNLFRDPTDPGSIYDELLVVRPPKRVVGGFLVRF